MKSTSDAEPKLYRCKTVRADVCPLVMYSLVVLTTAYYSQLLKLVHHIRVNQIMFITLSGPLDPYQRAEGDETILHWACQSKEKSSKLLQQLLE